MIISFDLEPVSLPNHLILRRNKVPHEQQYVALEDFFGVFIVETREMFHGKILWNMDDLGIPNIFAVWETYQFNNFAIWRNKPFGKTSLIRRPKWVVRVEAMFVGINSEFHFGRISSSLREFHSSKVIRLSECIFVQAE